MKKNLDLELKNVVDWVLGKLNDFFRIDSFKEHTKQYISTEYQKGLDKVEVQLQMNFVPDHQELNFLTDYVQNNLQFATDEVGNKLRQVISRSQLDGLTTNQLRQQVKQTLDDSQYTQRLKTIIRTEGLRASNYGSLQGAKQSGLNLRKWVDIVDDNRTSVICHLEDSKYGSPEKAVPLDEDFVVKYDNKIVRSQAPPFHPNCRSVLRISVVRE